MTRSYIRPLSSGELVDLPFGLFRALGWPLIWLHVIGLLPWLAASAALLAPLAEFVPTNSRMFNNLELASLGAPGPWRWMLWFFSGVLLAFPLAAGTWKVAWHIMGIEKHVLQSYAETWRSALRLMPLLLVLLVLLWIGNLLNVFIGIGTIVALCAVYPFYIGWSFGIEATVLEGSAGPAALRRGWQLCGTQRARHVWNMLVQSFMMVFVVSVPGLLTVFATEFLLEMGTDARILALYVVSGLCLFALSGWVTCAHVLAYYDLRARREALDIQLELTAIKGGAPA